MIHNVYSWRRSPLMGLECDLTSFVPTQMAIEPNIEVSPKSWRIPESPWRSYVMVLMTDLAMGYPNGLGSGPGICECPMNCTSSDESVWWLFPKIGSILLRNHRFFNRFFPDKYHAFSGILIFQTSPYDYRCCCSMCFKGYLFSIGCSTFWRLYTKSLPYEMVPCCDFSLALRLAVVWVVKSVNFTEDSTVAPLQCGLLMWYTKATRNSNWPHHCIPRNQCK